MRGRQTDKKIGKMKLSVVKLPKKVWQWDLISKVNHLPVVVFRLTFCPCDKRKERTRISTWIWDLHGEIDKVQFGYAIVGYAVETFCKS